MNTGTQFINSMKAGKKDLHTYTLFTKIIIIIISW